MKGDNIAQYNESGYKLQLENNSGWTRVVSNANGPTPSNIMNSLVDLLFKGRQGIDWTNFFNAKTDNSRLTIKYDHTTAIRSGNANGIMRQYNRWHPMNKTLVYDDDENGTRQSEGFLSTQGRAGMGDYYVIDIIAAGSGSTISDVLTFNPSATLYWHER